MNKIQFTGFISIIEREFGVDLHELTEEYAVQYNTEASKASEPFVISQQENIKQTQGKGVYIAAGLLVMAVVILMLKPSSEKDEVVQAPATIETTPVVKEINDSAIEEAKLNLSSLGNTTIHAEESEVVVDELRVEPAHTSKFEIIPRSNLWIGIINLETFERTQRLSFSPFELDKDKDWLLVMGHGFVNFDVNGETVGFKEESKVWFSYENGTLRKLSRSEFKEKNRGKAW